MNTLLKRLTAVYGAPETPNPDGFMAEYTRQMRNFVESECEAAADDLIAKRKYKTWPTVKECLDALEDVRRRQTNKRLAEAYQAKLATQEKPQSKPVSAAQQREDERFVDEWAAGKRSLVVPRGASPQKVIEVGLLSASLRRMAKAMRDRRRARV